MFFLANLLVFFWSHWMGCFEELRKLSKEKGSSDERLLPKGGAGGAAGNTQAWSRMTNAAVETLRFWILHLFNAILSSQVIHKNIEIFFAAGELTSLEVGLTDLYTSFSQVSWVSIHGFRSELSFMIPRNPMIQVAILGVRSAYSSIRPSPLFLFPPHRILVALRATLLRKNYHQFGPLSKFPSMILYLTGQCRTAANWVATTWTKKWEGPGFCGEGAAHAGLVSESRFSSLWWTNLKGQTLLFLIRESSMHKYVSLLCGAQLVINLFHLLQKGILLLCQGKFEEQQCLRLCSLLGTNVGLSRSCESSFCGQCRLEVYCGPSWDLTRQLQLWEPPHVKRAVKTLLYCCRYRSRSRLNSHFHAWHRR